jgi:UTP-glucose-1-phosphate uridylyltransferase
MSGGWMLAISQLKKRKPICLSEIVAKKKESQENYRATVTGKFVAATRVWELLRQFAVAHNLMRICAGGG